MSFASSYALSKEAKSNCITLRLKLLIDKDMKKKDLREAAGISTSSMAKLGKNENVTTDVLVKICKALNCDISDIMEIEPDE